MPSIIILAGPNGAGKTTASSRLLQYGFGIDEFVNADTIAAGLSAMHPERVALSAGRIMLQRMKELARAGQNFGFETTLASRSFAPWLAELKRDSGYRVELFFFSLVSAELAIARVASRVNMGGHHVDDAVVRRRYTRGLVNFFSLYRSLTSRWRFYDNSTIDGPTLLADGGEGRGIVVHDQTRWDIIRKDYDNDARQQS